MEQNSVLVAEQLLDKICEVDNIVKRIMLINKSAKDNVISVMSENFKNIITHYPHLVEDVQNRIVRYHINNIGSEAKVSDFIHLVWWYSTSLLDKEKDYWDTTGKYYGLRMNEVIDMFLIARDYCGNK